MNTVLTLIGKRRSVRAFDPRPVEREKLEAVLEAGRLAPSACNEQCWRFFVVESPELLAQMRDICNGQGFCAEAGAALFVTTYNQRDMSCGQPARTVDASIALAYMMLEATELGLSTCWIGNFNQAKARALLNLPEGEEIVALTPIGYALEDPKPRPRKKLGDITVFL